jgi:hypothetical protein
VIVVKIELHSARTGRVTQLGEMHISNDGVCSAQDPSRGSYRAELTRKPLFLQYTKTATVEDWPRNKKTVWQLLQRVLNKMYPKDVKG